MDAVEYETERAIAATIASRSQSSFSAILNEHALIMIDASHKDLPLSDYVKVGERLRGVKDKWLNLLCGTVVRDEVDREYRTAMASVIEKFTQHLNEVVLDNKFVPYEELASIGIAHASVTPQARSNVKYTRELFEQHVDALCKMYQQTRGTCNHMRAAIYAIKCANRLGVHLDYSILKK